MKFLIFILILSFSKSYGSEIFSLKRKNTKIKIENSFEFKRKNFRTNKDFLILLKNKNLFRSGTILKAYVEKEIFASYKEPLPVFVRTYKPKALFLGEIKALENTSNAFISLKEVIMNNKRNSIEIIPIILKGDKKEALLKEVILNFLLELPKAFSFFSKQPFEVFNLTNKNQGFVEKEKRELLEYLVIKQIEPIKIIIK